MALGSFRSPAEYHILYIPACSSHITCGHIRQIFSQGFSGDMTGLSLMRFQATPSRLVA